MAADAWDLAHRAASEASVELRVLTSLEDADALTDVLLATWGEGQVVPREMTRALAESGNEPYGAFADGRLVGYVLGWAGVDEREGLHVHSHMLAALPERRHGGIGYALKLAQRAQALDRGITLARWTFDPLVARNAYFNLHKLGALVDRFDRNFYGEMADALNRGDRSDRFLVRWDLERAPGPRSVAAEAASVLLRRGDGDVPELVGDEAGDLAVVEVPADHAELRARDPRAAAAWRDAVAKAADVCLGSGMVGLAFDRSRSAYVFGSAEAAAPGGAGTP